MIEKGDEIEISAVNDWFMSEDKPPALLEAWSKGKSISPSLLVGKTLLIKKVEGTTIHAEVVG